MTSGTEDRLMEPASGNRRMIPTTCKVHGARGFCNLLMTKVDGTVVLDPHVSGTCVLVLAENEATAVRDTLTEWLG